MLSALSSDARGLLVCTAEDADSLAQGLFDELSSTTGDLKLACFWNLRTRPATKHDQTIDLDVAPIVRRYEEPSVSRPDFVVIAKSVISSGCVVRHNLLDIIDRKKPKRIFVASPVMLEGADDRLRSEFPSVIAKRMEFIYFAIDNAKDESGMLRPGIGGSIYERLGSQRNAKEFTPKLVLARRLSLNGF
jgi:hypothetical protein